MVTNGDAKMRNGRTCLALAAVCAAASAAAFDKIALMDSLDMAYWCDVETKEGTVKLIEDCLRPDANVILWRDKGASWMRYTSREEMSPIGSEYIVDKRRVPPKMGAYWDLRLDKCGFDVFAFVYDQCRRRELGYGIHQTFEECHTGNSSQSLWTLSHPETWHCRKDGVPWPGHSSMAYPEVMEHKLRFADEHIALKPQRIFLDLWRCGSYGLQLEYVKPNIEKWRRQYPGEPLPDWKDERWTRLVSGPMMSYLREYGRRCKAAGIEFVIGLPTSNQEGGRIQRSDLPGREREVNDVAAWKIFGVDWKQLAKEGAIGGVWVMDVKYDPERIWESLRETLDYIKANAAGCKCYFGLNAYNMRHESYKEYAKITGCTNAEAVHKLMTIVTEAGYDGVVYECVDCHCYKEEGVCEELKKWPSGSRPSLEEFVAEGTCPAVSPDGRSVAFQRWEGDNVHVGVKDLESGKTTWVVRGDTPETSNENACHPAWSPDGSLVFAYANLTNTSYQRFSAGGPRDGYGLRVWKDGKSTDIVRGRMRNFTPSYSPDGRRIYCCRQVDTFCEIVSLNADDSGATNLLTSLTVGSGVNQPVVSPDGRLIAWAELPDFYTVWSLKVAKLSSPQQSAFTLPGDMAAYAPNWLPDSRHLLCTGFRAGDPTWSVYIVDVVDGGFRRLATGEDACASPDGKWVYYSVGGRIRRFALTPEMYPDDAPQAPDVTADPARTVFRRESLKKGEELDVKADGADPQATRFCRFTFTHFGEKKLAGMTLCKFAGGGTLSIFMNNQSINFLSRDISDKAYLVNCGEVLSKGRHSVVGIRGKDGSIYVSLDGGVPVIRRCGLGLLPFDGDGKLTVSADDRFEIRDFEIGLGWPKDVPPPVVGKDLAGAPAGDVVEHVALEVADPAAMIDWWVKNLGFKVTLRRAKGSAFIVDGSGRLALEVYGPQGDHPAPDYHKMPFLQLHFGFFSNDVEADEKRLVAAGATVVARDDAPGLQGFLARDPQGIPIQFLKRDKSILTK